MALTKEQIEQRWGRGAVYIPNGRDGPYVVLYAGTDQEIGIPVEPYDPTVQDSHRSNQNNNALWELGPIPIMAGAAGAAMAGVGAAGAAGAAGTAGAGGTAAAGGLAGLDAATAAGAMGGAAGTAGGGLTVAEAAGGLAGAAGAGGTAAGASPIISNFVPTTAATNPMTGATLSGGASTLSSLTGGNADLIQLGGTLGAAALGYKGAEASGDRLDALSREYMELGAPSRARYEASFAPGFKPADMPGFQDTLDTSWETALRKLSTTGNPYDSPGGLAEAQKYVVGNVGLPALNEYRRLNAGSGGLATLTAAAPNMASGAITADEGRYDAAGGALADLTRRRQPNFADYLRSLS